jgi:hypothetical protein
MKIDNVRFDNVTISSCPQGEVLFDVSGTYSWVAPPGVTSVSVVAVGAGGAGIDGGGSGGVGTGSGGGGGALAYKNNIAVVPGTSYTVVVGAASLSLAGTASSFSNGTITLTANPGLTATFGGAGGAPGGTFDGGGTGGQGGNSGNPSIYNSGGGGAGGYSGNGGQGGAQSSVASNGAGGGGGGGSTFNPLGRGSSGGGVGVWGIGSNGLAGTPTTNATGGSGGSNGGNNNIAGDQSTYGGGGSQGGASRGFPGRGAVRIVWPGQTRSFPSTNVGRIIDYGLGLPNPVNALGTPSLQASYDPQDPASFPGTTAYNDISGNGWNGTFAVSPTRDTQATVTFNGSTQIVTIPNATSQLGGYSSTTGLSFVMWIRISSLAAIQYIFDRRNTSAVGGVSLLVLTNGTIRAQNGGNDYSVSTTTLVTGAWYNIVVTFNTSEIVSYYINNSSAQNGAGSGTISNSATPLKIGATANNSSLFNGQIGQFVVYRTTLTAADVAYIYNTTKWRYGL